MLVENKRQSILYVVVTFLISYACWGTLALLGLNATGSAGTTILYMLGGLSPTIVALLLPLFEPKPERAACYKRFFKIRISIAWYLIPIIPVLVMTCLSFAVVLLFFGDVAKGLNIQPLYMIVPLFFMMIIGGGLEEFGWRGILVQNFRKMHPLLTSLGIGVVWACWHIPLFFIHGVTQYQGLFPPFLISVVAFSLVTTALYLRSGSVIPCILAHAWFNAFLGLGFFYGTHQAAAYADGLIRLAVGIAFFLIVAGKKEKFAHNIV